MDILQPNISSIQIVLELGDISHTKVIEALRDAGAQLLEKDGGRYCRRLKINLRAFRHLGYFTPRISVAGYHALLIRALRCHAPMHLALGRSAVHHDVANRCGRVRQCRHRSAYHDSIRSKSKGFHDISRIPDPAVGNHRDAMWPSHSRYMIDRCGKCRSSTRHLLRFTHQPRAIAYAKRIRTGPNEPHGGFGRRYVARDHTRLWVSFF